MPLVYADEDVAAAEEWYQPYMEVMGFGDYLQVGQVRHGRPLAAVRARWDNFMYTPPTPQIGVSLFERVGLTSPLTKYEKKGMSLANIFARFRAVHAQADKRIAGIPKGRVRRELSRQSRRLADLRGKLEPAFAPGAKVGKVDRKNLEDYVIGVKTLRKAVNKYVAQYGLRPVPDAEEVTPEVVKEDRFPIWLLAIPAALLLT